MAAPTLGRTILIGIVVGIVIGVLVGILGGTLGWPPSVRGGITGALVVAGMTALRKRSK